MYKNTFYLSRAERAELNSFAKFLTSVKLDDVMIRRRLVLFIKMQMLLQVYLRIGVHDPITAVTTAFGVSQQTYRRMRDVEFVSLPNELTILDN